MGKRGWLIGGTSVVALVGVVIVFRPRDEFEFIRQLHPYEVVAEVKPSGRPSYFQTLFMFRQDQGDVSGVLSKRWAKTGMLFISAVVSERFQTPSGKDAELSWVRTMSAGSPSIKPPPWEVGTTLTVTSATTPWLARVFNNLQSGLFP